MINVVRGYNHIYLIFRVHLCEKQHQEMDLMSGIIL